MMATSSSSGGTEPPPLAVHERYLEFPPCHEDTNVLYGQEEPFNSFVHSRLSYVLARVLHSVRNAPRPEFVVCDSRGSYTHSTSVYNGTAGIVLLLMRYLHALRHHHVHPDAHNRLPDVAQITPLLISTLHALESTLPSMHHDAAHNLHPGSAFFFGLPGILLTCACAHTSLSQPDRVRAPLQYLLSLAPYVAHSRSTTDVNELLYGRAGYLNCLSLLQHTLPTSANTRTRIRHAASTVIAALLSDGLRNATHPWPLLWHFHGKAYLGAAHGVSGILHALLTWIHLLTPPQLDVVMRTLNVLASIVISPCAPSLDRKTVLPPSARHEIMHWCHGPPGHIMLFTLALHRVRGTDERAARRYAEVIDTLAERIVQKGLLLKGAGLCHGVSGNCYAFLSAYRATRNERYLRLARAFCHVASTSSQYRHAVAAYHDPQRDVQGVPDTPFSLMEGAAGEACLLLDTLHPLGSSFPGFEYNTS